MYFLSKKSSTDCEEQPTPEQTIPKQAEIQSSAIDIDELLTNNFTEIENEESLFETMKNPENKFLFYYKRSEINP